MNTPQCEHDECTNPAIVGWGSTPIWLCQIHFEALLRITRRNVQEILDALGKFGVMPRDPNIVVPPSHPVTDGRIEIRHPVYLIRIMFENGDVVDVEVVHDNNWVTEDLMKWRNITNDRIVGHTRLGIVGYTTVDHSTIGPPAPTRPVRKRVAKKA